MKLLYLGTAAAEGLPASFCNCAICENARRVGGREVRSRAQLLVDGELLIDFPPDTYYHCLLHGLYLGRLHTLLVTHSHSDHWYPAGLSERLDIYQHGAEGLLDVYGNEAVLASYRRELCPNEACERDMARFVRVHVIRGGESVRRGEWEITAVPADHDPAEECLIYICKKGDKTLLYAHDTGIRLPPESWRLLAAQRFDVVSLDATTGRFPSSENHMGLGEAERFLARLRELGSAGPGTRCILSHFSHNGCVTQSELERYCAPRGLIPAHDGLEVEV